MRKQVIESLKTALFVVLFVGISVLGQWLDQPQTTTSVQTAEVSN